MNYFVPNSETFSEIKRNLTFEHLNRWYSWSIEKCIWINMKSVFTVARRFSIGELCICYHRNKTNTQNVLYNRFLWESNRNTRRWSGKSKATMFIETIQPHIRSFHSRIRPEFWVKTECWRIWVKIAQRLSRISEDTVRTTIALASVWIQQWKSRVCSAIAVHAFVSLSQLKWDAWIVLFHVYSPVTESAASYKYSS